MNAGKKQPAAPREKYKSTDRVANSKRIYSRALHILNLDEPISEELPGSRVFTVPSEKQGGVTYTVNLVRDTCNCKSWRNRNGVCKHIVAARMFLAHITGEPSESVPSGCKNPKYYERIRRVRRPMVRFMLGYLGATVKGAVV